MKINDCVYFIRFHIFEEDSLLLIDRILDRLYQYIDNYLIYQDKINYKFEIFYSIYDELKKSTPDS